MLAFTIRRMLLMIPTVFGLITLVFFFLLMVPGDPVDTILGETAAPADREALREALGLDQPPLTRYGNYLKNLARGDLGTSINYSRDTPVLELIVERFPYTAILALTAVTIALLIAIPLGVLAAVRQGSWVDFGTMAVGLLGISMPGFWLGMMLIIVFSFRLDLFPMPSEGGVLSIVLPAITLGVALAGILTRMTRSSMLDVIRSDYVRTARAKGLRPRVVIFRHALRNALMPVVTIAGLQLGALLTGAVITEKVFGWTGLGLLTFQAISNRDYPLVQGCVLVVALCYVLVNFVVDLAYAWIDPRVQLG